MTGGSGAAQFTTEDDALLARAADFKPCPQVRDCSPAALTEITRQHGLEFATAVLHDRVLRHPAHGSFFQRVQDAGELPAVKPMLVGIVPGAFYQQHKNTGADGARVASILEKLHCRCECVPVESFGSLARNASIIGDWLARHAGERIALVSLSKGGADLKMALALPNAAELFRDVVCWVSLSGLPHGTPLVAWLRRQPLRCLGVRLWLRLHGQRFSVLEELRHEADGPLANWPVLPSHLRVVHVVGFPLRRNLAHPWAARAYDRLAPLGPNDGGAFLLTDVPNLPGVVFPVWAADHYLQPDWDSTPIFRRLFAAAILSPGA